MKKPNAIFQDRCREELNNVSLRNNLNFVMDSLRQSRKNAFVNEDEFRQLQNIANKIKKECLNNFSKLLQQLEKKCEENGIRVHWAETAGEANKIILKICQENNAKMVIKGKSMVSEEIQLNKYLEKHGLQPIETDLGEYIIQLAGEAPSHIIAPAIHKNQKQIAELFHKKIKNAHYTEECSELTAIARKSLREKFYHADVGITGVNFAVAETGTICIAENEGNGRICSTLPPVHIALMGIDKVVPRLEHIPVLLKLLTRSSTGQAITTYFNIINSPRGKNEKDGPREVHLILLDNGRSKIYSDTQLRDTLMCIRCGACLNHCPVFKKIGGHAYKQVYSGPIGIILSPQINGLYSTGAIYQACTLCGACSEVCSAGIPIHKIVIRLRYEGVNNTTQGLLPEQGKNKKLKESVAWKLWQRLHADYKWYLWGNKIAAKLISIYPTTKTIKNWTLSRANPEFAPQILHDIVEKEGIRSE